MTDNNQFQRTEMLIGEEALERLKKSAVLVFGLGGVGSYVCEALVRAGVGKLEIVDKDVVDITNINRQLIALHSTIGRAKADVEAERLMDINPSLDLTARKCFYLPENSDEFDFGKFDYVVDAIDTVTGKLELVEQAQRAGVPVISCMGAGNKMDPTAFEVADIYETSVCPLARVMRRELKKRGIQRLKVVYSKEPAMTPLDDMSISCRTHCICPPGTARKCTQRRQVPGSNAFVPSAAGLILAGEVVKDLSGYSAGLE